MNMKWITTVFLIIIYTLNLIIDGVSKNYFNILYNNFNNNRNGGKKKIKSNYV